MDDMCVRIEYTAAQQLEIADKSNDKFHRRATNGAITIVCAEEENINFYDRIDTSTINKLWVAVDAKTVKRQYHLHNYHQFRDFNAISLGEL